MRSLSILLVLGFVLSVWGIHTFPNGYTASKITRDHHNGNIRFMFGKFGSVRDTTLESLHRYIDNHYEFFNLTGTEQFVLHRQETDKAGDFHAHFNQLNRGLKVDGGELSLHIDSRSLEVFALSLSLLRDDKAAPYNNVKAADLVKPTEAIRAIVPAQHFVMRSQPELVYFLLDGKTHLVWRADVEYTPRGSRVPTHSYFYANAVDGTYVFELSLQMEALERVIFNAENNDTLPGNLMRIEGQSPVADVNANQAYENTGLCYAFYLRTFDRDSWDNQGGVLISSVHYKEGYDNAFWNGTQMVFGDGDGQNFTDFTGDLSVICHELTHAVVQSTANLRYWNESGALNEGFADIFGASSVIVMENGTYTNTTWMIGPKCYLQGPALRYMNNPPLDGSSYDYYPTRFKGILDKGGVHSNSGIANLAYVLTVQGGVHPNQKTTNWVQGIGLSQAMQVYYLALTNYLQQTSHFSDARAATETAALKLYGKYAQDSVSAAWEAVSVPDSSV